MLAGLVGQVQQRARKEVRRSIAKPLQSISTRRVPLLLAGGAAAAVLGAALRDAARCIMQRTRTLCSPAPLFLQAPGHQQHDVNPITEDELLTAWRFLSPSGARLGVRLCCIRCARAPHQVK